MYYLSSSSKINVSSIDKLKTEAILYASSKCKDGYGCAIANDCHKPCFVKNVDHLARALIHRHFRLSGFAVEPEHRPPTKQSL